MFVQAGNFLTSRLAMLADRDRTMGRYSMRARRVKMRRLSGWLAFGFWAFIFLFPQDGNAQPLHYKGKTITVIEGRSPGGVGDLRTKAILPFLQKYIPGKPTIVQRYCTGGGGRHAGV